MNTVFMMSILKVNALPEKQRYEFYMFNHFKQILFTKTTNSPYPNQKVFRDRSKGIWRRPFRGI